MRRIRLKRWIAAVAMLYLAYVLVTGILPFLRCIPVSQEFADSVSPAHFYADAPCTDRVALVESPAEGFDTRIHILDEAQKSIDVSYYGIHMGESTDLFLGALLGAADRGVHIRILVDGQFGGLTGAHRDYAVAVGAHPNIELKLYNPPHLLKPWTWNGRLHDKYIIIDDRLLLLGGRNIGDQYFGPEGYEKPLSFDRDVLVYNTAWAEAGADSVLFDVRAYMDSLWDSQDVRQPFSEDTRRGGERRETLGRQYEQFCGENPHLLDHTGDDYLVWTCSANRITFFHNDTQIGPKEPKTGYVLERLLLDASKTVTLQSPYVILDDMLENTLEQLDSRQIDAQILTNSVASSPNPIACTAYSGDRSRILKTGVRLWEYQGANSIHAKAYLIDDRMAVVGSYNLDPRSAYLDTELMLAIDSVEFTRQLKQAQDQYMQQSLEVGQDGAYQAGQPQETRPLPSIKQTMVYALYPFVWLLKNLA